MGRTNDRGYGKTHRRVRASYAQTIRTGQGVCWRCGLPIAPDEPWDLGHDDYDRTKYRGPEHIKCNRGAPRRRARWSL